MGRYRVYMQQVVGRAVEVEADDGEEAVEKASAAGQPKLMFVDHTFPDEGEWVTASELFPETNKPEEDWELIEE